MEHHSTTQQRMTPRLKHRNSPSTRSVAPLPLASGTDLLPLPPAIVGDDSADGDVSSSECSPGVASPGKTAAVASSAPRFRSTHATSSDDSDMDEPICHASHTPPHTRTRLPSRAPKPNPHEMRSNRPRVLVTGGAGFIGSHTCRALLERGEDIVIADEINDYYPREIKLANLSRLLQDFGESRVHIYCHDICDADAMQQCYETERFDRVIHLAARAGVRPSISDPLLYEHSNVRGTIVLLEMARKANGSIKHFTYASSSSVYGDEAAIPFNETDPCNHPVSPYAATKKAAEMHAAVYANLHKLPCSGMRFFTAYGPNGRRDMAPFLFTSKLARGETITQFGDGSTERDYTFIEDLVQGILKVLDHVPGEFKDLPKPTSFDQDLHQIYNLGVGSPISLKEFISTIAKELQVSPKISIQPKQPGDVERTFADISKARRMLGYHPKVSVQEGIKRFVKWFRENELNAISDVTNTLHPTVANLLSSINSSAHAAITVPLVPRFPPLQHAMCATRIHNGNSSGERKGLTPDAFAHLMVWLPRALQCTQHVAIAVDTSDQRRDLFDAVGKVLQSLSQRDRTRVHLLGVSPWGSFTPALNALMNLAVEAGCEDILYSSLEIGMHPAHVHALKEHLQEDTLVVGARLSGHRFVRGLAQIDGCSTVWNTLALWNVHKLARTGFLSISDGCPAREQRKSDGTVITLPAVAGGVEEVVCVSAQQKLFPGDSKAKLLSMTSSTDETSWTPGTPVTATEGEEPAWQLSQSTLAAVATTSGASEDGESSEEEYAARRLVSGLRLNQHSNGNEQLLYDEAITPRSGPVRKTSFGGATRTPGLESRSGSSASAKDAPASSIIASASSTLVSSSSPSIVPARTKETIPSLFWDAHFGGDIEREKWHEKKMRSKIERPQQQLEALKLEPGTIEHVHVTISA